MEKLLNTDRHCMNCAPLTMSLSRLQIKKMVAWEKLSPTRNSETTTTMALLSPQRDGPTTFYQMGDLMTTSSATSSKMRAHGTRSHQQRCALQCDSVSPNLDCRNMALTQTSWESTHYEQAVQWPLNCKESQTQQLKNRVDEHQ